MAVSQESEFEHAKLSQHTSSLPKPNPWSVEAVLEQLPEQHTSGNETPIQFFHYVQRLKIEKREGWRRFGINKGESIADHMYRMSIISMLAPPSIAEKIDVNNCIKMSLIHDMAEGLVGDLTPVDKVPKTEKNRREATTMDWISKGLLGNVGGGIAGRNLRAVWQEYEDGETYDSKFVHDVDKIELILQMVEYERTSNCEIDLSEFSWVAKRLTLPETKVWAQEILTERTNMWASKGLEPREPLSAQSIQAQQDQYYGQENGHVAQNGTLDNPQ